MEHCGGLVYSGRAFPGGQAHRHDLLQSLPPDAGFLCNEELSGGHSEPVQAAGSMPGLPTLQRQDGPERRRALRPTGRRRERRSCHGGRRAKESASDFILAIFSVSMGNRQTEQKQNDGRKTQTSCKVFRRHWA